MADVASAFSDWSTTAGSNSPSDATTIGAGLADNFQQIQATIRAALGSKGADIASATTTDLGAVAGLFHDITGTTTITGFGTIGAGIWKVIKFEGALTLTHNSTSLILPGGANITTKDGDVAIMFSEGSGNWRCVSYQTNPATTFAPDVTLVGGAGNTTPVYSTNTGRVTKLGNRAFCEVLLTGDGGNEGAGTGVINIGLPYTSGASAPVGSILCGVASNGATSYLLTGQIGAGSGTIALSYFSSVSVLSSFTGADQNNATRSIRLNFSYETA